MAKTRKPSYLYFDDENYPWKPDIDYRIHPELYRVGRGEQGVLICEPYKSELSKHWRFRTPVIAERSSKIIFHMFEKYLKAGDFVGADMARKFLQMVLLLVVGSASCDAFNNWLYKIQRLLCLQSRAAEQKRLQRVSAVPLVPFGGGSHDFYDKIIGVFGIECHEDN
jgi:hypothetical protein